MNSSLTISVGNVQDKRHTMKSFMAYADWIKSVHFSEPAPGSQVRWMRHCTAVLIDMLSCRSFLLALEMLKLT